MEKIIVIGCPGSGKSTFSRLLHDITGIPLFHLDMMYWNSDRTTVEEKIFMERLSNVLQKDSWIIDGNFNSTLELRLQNCDTVVFLDYSLEVCLEGIKERKGKTRADMPWVEPEEDDTDFIEFVKNFNSQIRPNIIELLYKYPDKEVYIFRERNCADDFLIQQFPNSSQNGF